MVCVLQVCMAPANVLASRPRPPPRHPPAAQPWVLPEHWFFPLEPGVPDVERPAGVLTVQVLGASQVIPGPALWQTGGILCSRHWATLVEGRGQWGVDRLQAAAPRVLLPHAAAAPGVILHTPQSAPLTDSQAWVGWLAPTHAGALPASHPAPADVRGNGRQGCQLGRAAL